MRLLIVENGIELKVFSLEIVEFDDTCKYN